MTKQRLLVFGSFAAIAGTVGLYIFLGASDFQQSSVGTEEPGATSADNFQSLVSRTNFGNTQIREVADVLGDSDVVAPNVNVQAMTVVGENEVIVLEEGIKAVTSIEFRDSYREQRLYDFGQDISGNVEFAIIPRAMYRDYIILKVDGEYKVFFSETNRVYSLSLDTDYVVYDDTRRTIYAVENQLSADSRIVTYQINPLSGQFQVEKDVLFNFRDIDRVYTTFDGVFVAASGGLYRYDGEDLYRVFETGAAPRASFSPNGNRAVVNNDEGDSFVYTFTDDSDELVNLRESFLPSQVLWYDDTIIYEVTGSTLREYDVARYLRTGDTVGSLRRWDWSEMSQPRNFPIGIDSSQGVYFADQNGNLQYVSEFDRFE